MVRYKGQRTNKHREAEYPYAVDILNRYPGMGQDLDRIHDAIRPLGGDQWGYRAFDDKGVYQDWIRIGLKNDQDADRIVEQFRHLGAFRAR